MLKRERVTGSQGTDILLCRVKTSEEANEIRRKIMSHKQLKSTVYVFVKKKFFDIFISNELGGMPTDEHYETIREFIHQDFEEDLDATEEEKPN